MDLLIQLKPSRLYLLLIIFSAVVGFTGIVLASQPWYLSLVMSMIWILALWWPLHSWLNGPRLLRIGKLALEIEISDRWVTLEASCSLPFLIYFLADEKQLDLLVWKDALDPDEWRKLRMWLKVNRSSLY